MSHFQLSMIDPREIISFFSQFNSLSSMCPATHPRNPFLKGMTFATIFSAGKEARLKRVEDSNDKVIFLVLIIVILVGTNIIYPRD